MTETERLIHIIRFILARDIAPCNDEAIDWNKLISVAKANGVFQYVHRYITQLDDKALPPQEIIACAERRNALEIHMGILQEYVVDKLREGFGKSGIDYMFIKGTVTKNRYPDAYLRTMGDVDFLYRSEQHDLLRGTMKELGYTLKSHGRVHDIYTDNSGVLIEAHRQLLPASSPYSMFCEDLWARSIKSENYQHEHLLTTEDEFLFAFIHLASHFKKGGIGIRFIVDIWIYKQYEMDWGYIREWLDRLHLSDFYKLIDAVVEKWFKGISSEEDFVKEVEAYILAGGVFGTADNRRCSAIRKGKIKYFFKVCFPGYYEMKSMFPWLNSRWMLPFAWVRRGIDCLFKRRHHIRLLMRPLKQNNAELAKTMNHFFSRCGLE